MSIVFFCVANVACVGHHPDIRGSSHVSTGCGSTEESVVVLLEHTRFLLHEEVIGSISSPLTPLTISPFPLKVLL